jgi:hypothetical protein
MGAFGTRGEESSGAKGFRNGSLPERVITVSPTVLRSNNVDSFAFMFDSDDFLGSRKSQFGEDNG